MTTIVMNANFIEEMKKIYNYLNKIINQILEFMG